MAAVIEEMAVNGPQMERRKHPNPGVVLCVLGLHKRRGGPAGAGRQGSGGNEADPAKFKQDGVGQALLFTFVKELRYDGRPPRPAPFLKDWMGTTKSSPLGPPTASRPGSNGCTSSTWKKSMARRPIKPTSWFGKMATTALRQPLQGAVPRSVLAHGPGFLEVWQIENGFRPDGPCRLVDGSVAQKLAGFGSAIPKPVLKPFLRPNRTSRFVWKRCKPRPSSRFNPAPKKGNPP